MENTTKQGFMANPLILQSEELYEVLSIIFLTFFLDFHCFVPLDSMAFYLIIH